MEKSTVLYEYVCERGCGHTFYLDAPRRIKPHCPWCGVYERGVIEKKGEYEATLKKRPNLLFR